MGATWPQHNYCIFMRQQKKINKKLQKNILAIKKNQSQNIITISANKKLKNPKKLIEKFKIILKFPLLLENRKQYHFLRKTSKIKKENLEENFKLKSQLIQQLNIEEYGTTKENIYYEKKKQSTTIKRNFPINYKATETTKTTRTTEEKKNFHHTMQMIPLKSIKRITINSNYYYHFGIVQTVMMKFFMLMIMIIQLVALLYVIKNFQSKIFPPINEQKEKMIEKWNFQKRLLMLVNGFFSIIICLLYLINIILPFSIKKNLLTLNSNYLLKINVIQCLKMNLILKQKIIQIIWNIIQLQGALIIDSLKTRIFLLTRTTIITTTTIIIIKHNKLLIHMNREILKIIMKIKMIKLIVMMIINMISYAIILIFVTNLIKFLVMMSNLSHLPAIQQNINYCLLLKLPTLNCCYYCHRQNQCYYHYQKKNRINYIQLDQQQKHQQQQQQQQKKQLQLLIQQKQIKQYQHLQQQTILQNITIKNQFYVIINQLIIILIYIILRMKFQNQIHYQYQHYYNKNTNNRNFNNNNNYNYNKIMKNYYNYHKFKKINNTNEILINCCLIQSNINAKKCLVVQPVIVAAIIFVPVAAITFKPIIIKIIKKLQLITILLITTKIYKNHIIKKMKNKIYNNNNDNRNNQIYNYRTSNKNNSNNIKIKQNKMMILIKKIYEDNTPMPKEYRNYQIITKQLKIMNSMKKDAIYQRIGKIVLEKMQYLLLKIFKNLQKLFYHFLFYLIYCRYYAQVSQNFLFKIFIVFCNLKKKIFKFVYDINCDIKILNT
ncbi:uncharacterized protein LOC129607081 isoform X1 [Condylostylus longicornis]|uniref:uncharacterized protein LOC129607081 isoform X1 n=1 Tax=Condylostylus longicornis TaxID=2530218 RepID=UPI00244DBFBC|nr:uncharacterized protein LOC129607081 isoform X1 [Condylostylus longicornis]